MRRYLLIIGCIFSLILGACMPVYYGAAGGKTIGLWGDSTMGLAAEEVPARLNDRYQTSLTFASGKTLTQLQTMGDSFVNPSPDFVVISAGTNDVFEADGRAWNGFYEFALIHDTVAKYPNSKVIWMGLYEGDSSQYWPQVKRDRAIGFNNALDYWDANMPNFSVIDWNAAVNFLGVSNILLYDHVHGTHQGQQLFAYLIDDAISKA